MMDQMVGRNASWITTELQTTTLLNQHDPSVSNHSSEFCFILMKSLSSHAQQWLSPPPSEQTSWEILSRLSHFQYYNGDFLFFKIPQHPHNILPYRATRYDTASENYSASHYLTDAMPCSFLPRAWSWRRENLLRSAMTYNLMLDRKATRCLSLLLVGDALDGGCGLRVSMRLCRHRMCLKIKRVNNLHTSARKCKFSSL